MSTDSTTRALLQSDYGGFNPRFLGISVYYDSRENYDQAFTYLTGGEASDRPATGLNEIVLRSVGDHETRHYIDFLLSPYSVGVFRLRLMAVVNAAQALSAARQVRGDVIPVPISRWLTLDPEDRAGWQDEWQTALGAEAAPIELPYLTESELETNLGSGVEIISHLPIEAKLQLHSEAASRAYRRIDQLTQGFVAAPDLAYLRPVYVNEASALSVQLAAIYVGQGLEQTFEFLEFLLDSDLPQALMWRRHLQLATLLETLHSGSSEPVRAVRRILSITVWSLLGDYVKDGRAGCPASRFCALLTAVMDDPGEQRWSGDIDDPDSLSRMWSFWDERAGASPWKQALAESLDRTERGLQQFDELLSTWAGDARIPNLARFALGRLHVDQKQVAKAFLDDPRILAVPETYVTHVFGRLPFPDLRIEYRGFGVMSERDSGAGLPLTRRKADGTRYVAGMVCTHPPDDEQRLRDLRKKLDLEALTECCDLLFSALSVPDHATQNARAVIEELTGKRVLQLI